MNRLFLIDAYALIYRSYFAFIRAPRYNSSGLNTSTMLGFVNTLEQLLQKEKPSHLAVVFDVHSPTFRHEMYAEYKATREEMPEDLRAAIPWVRQIIEAYNIPIIEKKGFEADDVIGTLSVKAEQAGFEVLMMTPDKDYAQLVTPKVRMYKPGRSGKESEIWGVKEVCENFEINTPSQVIDILGLMGDASDNIPGCPGIGPKTAQKLIGKYGSINGIYEHIEELKGKQKENLIEHEAMIRLSRELVVIAKHVPVELDEAALRLKSPNSAALNAIFSELEFRNWAQRYPAAEVEVAVQRDLFSDLLESEEEEEPKPSLKSIAEVEHCHILVENDMQRASLRAELSVQKEFAFTVATDSLDAMNANLLCLAFSFKSGEAYCVTLPENRAEACLVAQEFALVFGDESILKVAHNLKFAKLMLKQYGVEIIGAQYDTQLAHYLINPDLRHSLDYLCEIYLRYKKINIEDLLGKRGKNQLSFTDLSVEEMMHFVCEHADCCLQLKKEIDSELDKQGARALFDEIEIPLVDVLTDMELVGMNLHVDSLNEYGKVLRQEVRKLEHQIINLAGEQFNVSSPRQLGVVLFENLNIEAPTKKTKSRQYSTSEEVLSGLIDKHPIVPKVLEYRGLKKLLSTYVEALPLLVNTRTGRLHSSFNQAVTATGRLSSTNPNLQNIPIRDEAGREVRKAFTATDDNHVFLSADYSQIELRIMASLSGDEHMIEAFRQGVDVHSSTAAKIYKVPLEEVTNDMRRKAKTANFGIIYGISAFGLAQRLNIPRKEAKQLINGYFENFPRIKEYMDECIAKARQQVYVETIKGRRRYLSDINSANSIVRGIAERNAINAPIQGSAADIIKIAMINIHRAMKEAGLQSKLVLQVHDELNFEVLASELDQMKQLVSEQMEAAIDLNVPLLVDMKAARNWEEAH